MPEPMGRRVARVRASAYRPDFAALAEELCRRGALDQDLADRFRVYVRTIHRWKRRHEEFCNALKAGKAAWRGRPRDLGRAGSPDASPLPAAP
jgi:hypothetical protein